MAFSARRRVISVSRWNDLTRKSFVFCILLALNQANAHLGLLLFHQSPPLNAFGGD
jgi:predicted solute-binding protein